MAIKQIPLANIPDIRREMACVYREARAKKLDSTEAHRLTMILKEICKAAEIELNSSAGNKENVPDLSEFSKIMRGADTKNANVA